MNSTSTKLIIMNIFKEIFIYIYVPLALRPDYTSCVYNKAAVEAKQ